jgi:hypothetical protein
MVLFLHGGQTHHEDNFDDNVIDKNGNRRTDAEMLDWFICNNGGADAAPIEFATTYGFAVLLPTCPMVVASAVQGRPWWFVDGSKSTWENYKMSGLKVSAVADAMNLLVAKIQEEINPSALLLAGVSTGGFGALNSISSCNFFADAISAVGLHYPQEDVKLLVNRWIELQRKSDRHHTLQIITCKDEATWGPQGVQPLRKEWEERQEEGNLQDIDFHIIGNAHLGNCTSVFHLMAQFLIRSIEANGISNAEILYMPNDESSSSDEPIAVPAFIPRFFLDMPKWKQKQYGFDWRKAEDEYISREKTRKGKCRANEKRQKQKRRQKWEGWGEERQEKEQDEWKDNWHKGRSWSASPNRRNRGRRDWQTPKKRGNNEWKDSGKKESWKEKGAGKYWEADQDEGDPSTPYAKSKNEWGGSPAHQDWNQESGEEAAAAADRGRNGRRRRRRNSAPSTAAANQYSFNFFMKVSWSTISSIV